ncbi:conjugal transfer protein TrbE [Acidiphilium multivorum]|uniref:conjugal transfer protein TrbE n=1 Tax=Acidiphilium multivorum TaxID=62140 RepID=UPI001B8BE8B6|nr:conjugal transfer protein TrbE [Acidiphilium multivorum]MBS3025282.1 conjugal transfer protein TrbE [Acidiphilium multivorum]MDA8249208.1 conjugal transfer protein TrbE [Rhodospirillales bacterium]
MLDLREYRNRRRELADFLPWAGLVGPGIVLNKDGALQRSAQFRGPDLDSSTAAELIAVTARVNNALKRLGEGWALFVEAARTAAPGYPPSRFPDPVSWLVDEERRHGFEEAGAHFESRYYLTFCYLAPPERAERTNRLLYERAHRPAQRQRGPRGRAQGRDQDQNQDQDEAQGRRRGQGKSGTIDWRGILDGFVAETDRVLDLLASLMPDCAWLDDAETLAYLHATISTNGYHPVAVPEVPFYLDGLLPDCDLTPGVAPMLGRCHLRTITLRGLPDRTWPGLLDDLNRLPLQYRWVARWLPLEKPEAQKELGRKRRHWWAKRKGIAALLREVIWQQETRLVDTDAENQSLDADIALQELGSDAVSFGYFTATVTVWDTDEAAVAEKLRQVGRAVRAQGFVAVEETLNAVEAWLGSLPGQCYANIRQPLVSSLNLVHMLPLSAVWAGPGQNVHLDGPPLLIAHTAGSTPFRLVLHQGDVGHTLIIGPTGAGKSVLLALIALQFRRYAGARVIIFDKGRSSKAAVLGMGGAFHDLDLGGAVSHQHDHTVAFQPLARINDAAERAWAADWIATLLVQESIDLTPEVRGAIWSALGSLATAPLPERTLSGFAALLQANRLKAALEPYTIAGPFGRLLDAEQESIGNADVLAFETEDLLGAKHAARAVLTYLFHRIEAGLDGRPTLIAVDEAWFALDDPVFAPKLREWLKTLRRKNASVLFSTQSLADITRSPVAPAVNESCLSRIFLPNARAIEPESRDAYARLGLNDRQIATIARAVPKREYWFQSAAGCRLFELGLSDIALAFCGVSRAEDLAAIDRVMAAHGPDEFPRAWLRERGLGWAAELLPPSHAVALDQSEPSTKARYRLRLDAGVEPTLQHPHLPFSDGVEVQHPSRTRTASTTEVPS